MADRRLRPGRTLVVFFLGVAICYGLVALTGTWKPALGLDLEGGTRITLTATETPSQESLEEARKILDQRVNGSGVSEAEVTTQGDKFIVVEVPGSTENRNELEETVSRQAQLRFRLVACSPNQPNKCATGTPGLGRVAPDLAPGDDPTDAPADGKNKKSDKDDAAQQATESAGPTGDSSDPATAEPTDGSTQAPAEGQTAAGDGTAEGEIAWSRSPDAQSVALYNASTCTADGVLTDAEGKPAELVDDPDKPLVACGEPQDGQSPKYLLSRSIIEGTELTDASAGIPQNQLQWVVNIEMGNDTEKANPPGSTGAADDFETVSREFQGTDEQFAIVLDGQVLSAPVMTAVITDGQSQIEGDFNETTANSLATSLKYGALPITFEDEPTVEEIGPSLAGNQLTAGLTAGAFGLALVMLYCLFYYRGLGLVVVASLFVAASVTYAMVLLLSETAGFTLTLPGIAGLIIAVGVTADSFVIFFERIRDEMREGKSMRVAVETGWARARVTRIAANTVQLLSAAVLYIFATGAVKGFGFALGLTTLIDLAVLFWFTKPMVSWLAQFKFFNSGNKWSGLSKETLGMDAPRPARTVGGEA
ncbi:protein translocase subunit SecD [Nocardioides sambongensis]|uniref:protein translocase subunit SecD n=1 Tax=Nocardioides sambongensis TaxID=2589074 RepID=UPI00112CDF96|nr:protein translocase subunit SecD [Nocardioides sambongensis]